MQERRVLGVAGVVLAVLVGLAVVLLRDGSVERDEPPLSPEAPPAVVVVQPLQEPGLIEPEAMAVPTARPEPQAAPEGSAPVARLSGRVSVRGESEPVPGVEVLVRTRRAAGGRRENLPLRSTTTDAEGRYSFAFTEATEVRSVVVCPGAATTGASEHPDQVLVPPAVRELDITVTHGATVSGRVLDERGLPVPQARVLLLDEDLERFGVPAREEQTDAAGRYAFAAVGERVTLEASVPGHVCTVARYGLPARSRAYVDIDLRVEPARLLPGRVVDASGAGVPDARLEFMAGRSVPADGEFTTFQPEPEARSTDAKGAFAIESQDDATWLQWTELSVEHAEHATWTGPPPATIPMLIRLGLAASLEGFVMDAAGVPLEGAAVTAQAGRTRGRTVSAVDGSYRLGLLPPGEVVCLMVHAPGHALVVIEDIEQEPTGRTRRDVRLEPGFLLAGRVTDANGQPVAACRVQIEGDRLRNRTSQAFPTPTWENWFGLDEVLTDAAGRFTLPDLYEGSFEVSAYAPTDDQTRAVVNTRTPDEQIELMLPDPARLRVRLHGRLTDGVTGAPIEEAVFTFLEPDAGGGWSGTPRNVEAPGGNYDFMGPMAGLLRLFVGADDHADLQGEPQDWPAGPQRLDIALDPLRNLTVQVVDAAGHAVAAQVEFRDEAGRAFGFDVRNPQRAGWLLTDEDGLLKAGGLPARRLTVTARKLPDVASAAVDLRADVSGTLRLVLGHRRVRKLVVTVVASREALEEDLDKGIAREMLENGRLQRVTGNSTLAVTEPDGTSVASATAKFDGPNLLVDMLDLDGNSSSRGGPPTVAFSCTVSQLALSVVVTADGLPTWHKDLPAGEEDVQILAVLPGH